MPQMPISMVPHTLIQHDAGITSKEIHKWGQPNLKTTQPQFSCDSEHLKAPTHAAQ